MATDFGSGYGLASPTGPAALSDQLINPVTLDYYRTANGEWQETPDSRSTMLIMLSLRLGASPFDPADGVTIGFPRDDGSPVTADEILSETRRAAGILQADGIISGFVATITDGSGAILRNELGAALVRTSWRDLASGSPVDLIFQPG